MSNDQRRVWITGIGPITAIGTGLDAFRAGLRAGVSPVKRIDRFDPSPFRSQVAAQIDDFDPLAWMPPKTARQLDRFSQFGLVAGQLALDDAGLRPGEAGAAARRADRDLSRQRARRDRLRRGAARALPRARDQGGRAEPRPGGVRRRGAGQPRDRPRRPRPDPLDGELVRVGRGRDRRGARRDPGRRDRRGDRRRRRGPAEPARVRRVRHHPGPVRRAQRRPGPRLPAVRRRARRVRHGRGRDAPRPRGRGRRPGARRRALCRGHGLRGDLGRVPHGPAAGRRPRGRPRGDGGARRTRASAPDEIDWVSAHASSTPLGDIAEARAIALALGARAATVPVSGTKALYGHPLGASGAIEAAICALAIRDGWVPASANLEAATRTSPSCSPGCSGRGRDGTYRRILSTSFGFGGLNAGLVIGAVDA